LNNYNRGRCKRAEPFFKKCDAINKIAARSFLFCRTGPKDISAHLFYNRNSHRRERKERREKFTTKTPRHEEIKRII